MRRLKNNIFLILGGVLFAMLLCEVGLRAAGISYPMFSQIDGEMGSSLRPGAEGWYHREGRAYVRINDAGLRDREHVLAKPDNTVRIAVLGDSYAEAVQVPMEDTFWSVLEREIKGCPRFDGREVEVINFGVSGYGTAQELLMLRQRVWRYSPDIVLLAFVTGNDIRNNSRALEQEGRKPYFIFKNGQLVADLSFRESLGFRLRQTEVARSMYRIGNSSRLFQVFTEVQRIALAPSAHANLHSIGIKTVNAAEKANNVEGSAPAWDGYAEVGLDAAVYVEPQDPAWKEAWAVTEGLLRLMRDDVREKGADFLTVTLSNSPQVHPDPAVRRAFEKRLGVPHLFYPDFRIRDLGQREGFAVLNLAPLFETVAGQQQMFLHGFDNSGLGKGHWNKEGHRLAGRLIAQELCPDLANRVHSASPQM